MEIATNSGDENVSIARLSKTPESIHNGERPQSSEDASGTPLEKRHICEICGKGFPYLSILESHKRCHTGEKPFSCHFCDKKFAQKATLQVHERTHTGERPYKCKYCEKTFAQYGTKTVHEKSAHLGIRNYKCPKCNKCLSSPSALYTHKKTHGEKTLQCGFCPKTFTLKNYLKLHIKQVHEQTDRKHMCHFCSKSFAYAGSLQVHVRTHTGERPYVCKYCPKAFASQGNLQSHERTHTGERPYSCLQCGRSFIQKSQLTAHEATHQYHSSTSTEGNHKKPNEYICKFCGKRYAYASSLYVHTRLHTGERPFRCSFCDKAFTNQGNMQVHQRVHTGEKPYKCTACDKSYAQKVGLKIHQEQCPHYLGERVVSPDKEDGGSPLIDSILPKLFGINNGRISMSPMQYSPQQSAQAVAEKGSASLGLKLPTVPATVIFSPATTSSMNGFSERPSNLEARSSSSDEPLANVQATGALTDLPLSAFRGVTPESSKSAIADVLDHQQALLMKPLIEKDLAMLISQQILARNQQLYCLLQSLQMGSSEQWNHLLSQQLALSTGCPNALSSLNLQTSPPARIQSDLIPANVKQESPMFV